MSVKVRVDISKLKELEGQLGKAAGRRPMKRSLLYLQSKVDKLEPKKPGAFTRWATRGQRIAFWRKVRAGLARVGSNGYIRTGQTAKSWTNRVERGGRRGVLGNNAPGARWVFGEPTSGNRGGQQPFHSHQPRIDKVAKRETDQIRKIYADEIDRLLGSLR